MGELVNYAKLKPCPFCGEIQISVSMDCSEALTDSWVVQCLGCMAMIRGFVVLGDTRDSTIAAWNRRAEAECTYCKMRKDVEKIIREDITGSMQSLE